MNILIANESRLVGEGMGMIVKSSFSEATIVVTDLIDDLLIQLDIGAKQRWEVILIDRQFSDFINPKQLHKLSPRVKVCLFNSKGSSQKRVEYSRKGFNGLLPPSSTPEQVEYAISTLLSGQNFFPEGVNIHPTKPIKEKPVISFNQTLTFRQQEILSMMALGLGNKAIASHYELTESTVKRHLSNIFKKLGVQNRVEAARVGSERRLLLN